MAYRIADKALKRAIKHLCQYGDTDVFPHLPEINFLREQEADVVTELEKLDLDTYEPGTLFEGLAPKSRYGFRIVHQMPLHDTVLLLGAVIDIGARIEARRPAPSGIEAFSYRFAPDDILVVTPRDRLEAADFRRMAAEVDPYLEQNGQLNGLLVEAAAFPGWSDFEALIGHFRFVHDHHRNIRRVAVVTESSLLRLLPRLAEHFARPEIRVFNGTEKATALAWLEAAAHT